MFLVDIGALERRKHMDCTYSTYHRCIAGGMFGASPEIGLAYSYVFAHAVKCSEFDEHTVLRYAQAQHRKIQYCRVSTYTSG